MNTAATTRRAVLAGAAALAAGPGARAQARPSVMVYAAASLQDALKDIAPLYTARTGARVTFSFAGSSLLARQIEQGARADVFVSADRDWMDYLAQRRLIRPETRRNLVSARLALIAPRNSRVQLAGIGRGFPLVQALGGGRLALADPDSVPAGRYAKAALTSLGVWPAAAPRVARADNVRAALAFVARGEAPLGVVYDTDARSEPDVRVVGLFPAGSHPPIVYPAAATVRSQEPAAVDFVRFLSGPQADEVFRRYGFAVVD